MLIDFLEESEDGTRFINFKTDDEVIAAVQKGVARREIVKKTHEHVRLDSFLGSISPENFYQNEHTGESNIEGARAANFYIYVRS